MDGLSSAELRALLKSEASSGHTVVWQAEYHTQGVWVATQFLYTCEVPHKASSFRTTLKKVKGKIIVVIARICFRSCLRAFQWT